MGFIMAKFKRGEINNPSGRPKGSGSRQKLFNELVMPHKDEIVTTAINLALSGNETILRVMLDRLLPKTPPDDPITFSIDLEGLALSEQSKKVVLLISSGELSPSEGNALLSALSTHSRLVETDELIKRIEKLENKS